MTKNVYLNTTIASVIAFVFLIIMIFSWPKTRYTLYDVILQNVNLNPEEKASFINIIGLNYALDTVFIFSWIGSWVGLFLHFKYLKVKLIEICFYLSLFGALLDILENTMSFTWLTGNYKVSLNMVILHTIIRDISYWLPMLASFIMVFCLSKQKGIPVMILKIIGSFGVGFAILGMYVKIFSFFPYYWFCLWFFASAIFLFNNFKHVDVL
jgi:hypothetical protein